MEHAPIITRGRALLLSGKCMLKQLLKLKSLESQTLLLNSIIKTLKSSQFYLEKAIGEIGSMEALSESYYLISRAYHSFPIQSNFNITMRDTYSQLFLDIRVV